MTLNEHHYKLNTKSVLILFIALTGLSSILIMALMLRQTKENQKLTHSNLTLDNNLNLLNSLETSKEKSFLSASEPTLESKNLNLSSAITKTTASNSKIEKKHKNSNGYEKLDVQNLNNEKNLESNQLNSKPKSKPALGNPKKISPPKPNLKTSKIDYSKICRDVGKFTILNKAPIIVTAKEGQLLPESCTKLIQDKKKCEEESLTLKNYVRPHELEQELHNLRQQNAELYYKWYVKFKAAVQTLLDDHEPRLTPEKKEIFDTAVNLITSLYASKQKVNDLKELNGGNCGELTSKAFDEIFQAHLSNHVPMRLHQIYLEAPENTDSIYDHVFLVLNSSLEDKDFSFHNDPQKVQNFLSQLEGANCDPWNFTFKERFQDSNSFYKNGIPWKKLDAFSSKYDPEGLKQLPFVFKYFIYNYFVKIGYEFSPPKGFYLSTQTHRLFGGSSSSQQLSKSSQCPSQEQDPGEYQYSVKQCGQ